MKRVLIITYYWPPSGGAGVQRWLKFSKYLPQFGWEPVILTVDEKSAEYPQFDKTLEQEVPPEMKVYRTPARNYFRYYKKFNSKKQVPSAGFANEDKPGLKQKILRFIRGNFFLPDPRKGWNSYALKQAIEIISGSNIDAIITTGPPNSTTLLGLKLKKRFPHIPWIVDFRDPWTKIYYYHKLYHTLPAKWYDRRLERRVLHGADRLITVSRDVMENFSEGNNNLRSKFHLLTNGFDPEDFDGKISEIPDVFTIGYVGTLSGQYPIKSLLDVIVDLTESGRKIRFELTGIMSREQREMITGRLGNDNVRFNQYLQHDEAIQRMMNSSLLLLILPEHPSARGIITGKVFEYLASGTPILCLGPENSEVQTIINKGDSGKSFLYDDTTGIKEHITDQVILFPDNRNSEVFSEYSRIYLTQRLTEEVLPKI